MLELRTLRLTVTPGRRVPLGLSDAEIERDPNRLAEYRDVPRPERPVDDVAKFAVLAAYGPEDLVDRVHNRPDKAAIYFSHDGGPWQVARLAIGESLGVLRVVRDGTLHAPAIAIPAGSRSTVGAIVWMSGDPVLAPVALTTCGVNRDGKLLHSIVDVGLSREDLEELDLGGDVPIAELESVV